MISLFIFKSSSRGMQYGIGTYIHELTDSLQRNHELKIFVVSYKNSSIRELSVNKVTDRLTHIDIPAPLFPSYQVKEFERKYASAVVRVLSDFIPANDEIIFQLNYIDDLHIGRLLNEKYNYPVISLVHFAQFQQLFNGSRKNLAGLNLDNPSNNIEFTLFSEKELYELSDHVVSVTAYMKDFLCEYYKIDPDKISVVPNGIDHTEFNKVSEERRVQIRHELGFEEDDVICLFSGRIDHCKGVGYLLPAFEEACRKADNLKLVLLGQGNLQEFQPLIKSAFGKVIYTGFLSKDKVKLFYQVADIGLLPSVYDHCPYTALEIIASGLPLIMSRIDGLDEILDESECFFIDPLTDDDGEIIFNINELSDLIIRLSEDKNLRNRLSENAYKKLLNRNTAIGMAASMNSIVQKIVRTHKLTIPV